MSGFVTRYPVKEPSLPVQASPSAQVYVPPVNYAPTSLSTSRNKLQVTPQAASHALQHLIASELKYSGFQGADAYAMETMERLVTDCT